MRQRLSESRRMGAVATELVERQARPERTDVCWHPGLVAAVAVAPHPPGEAVRARREVTSSRWRRVGVALRPRLVVQARRALAWSPDRRAGEGVLRHQAGAGSPPTRRKADWAAAAAVAAVQQPPRAASLQGKTIPHSAVAAAAVAGVQPDLAAMEAALNRSEPAAEPPWLKAAVVAVPPDERGPGLTRAGTLAAAAGELPERRRPVWRVEVAAVPTRSSAFPLPATTWMSAAAREACWVVVVEARLPEGRPRAQPRWRSSSSTHRIRRGQIRPCHS